MSEIATEASGSPEPITTAEFLGTSFAERCRALVQARAFARMTERALADNVEMLQGATVTARFMPSMTTVPQYPGYWFPCYPIGDETHEPFERIVVVGSVDDRRATVELADCRLDSGSPVLTGQAWEVRIDNIVSVEDVSLNDVAIETSEPMRRSE